MATVIERFEKEYQAYHDISPKRRKAQVKELRLFADFSGKASPEECTAHDLRAYMAELVDLDLHVNTVRKRGNYIRPFFTWSFSAGLVSGDELMAVRAVENPKGSTNRSKPRPYKAKELKRFWAELDRRWPYRDEKWWKRWRRGTSKYSKVETHVMRVQLEAIVALALDCGLRLSEIYHLDINDMHHDNEFVVVRPRTERDNEKNRLREVPHTEESRTRVRDWLELRHELKPGHDRPWISAFANQAKGGWLKPTSLERFCCLMQTIGEWELHRFRHTCATNWLRAGMDLEVVSRLIGHSSITQTLAYAEIVSDDIAKQVTKNEGRFRLMTGREVAA